MCVCVCTYRNILLHKQPSEQLPLRRHSKNLLEARELPRAADMREAASAPNILHVRPIGLDWGWRVQRGRMLLTPSLNSSLDTCLCFSNSYPLSRILSCVMWLCRFKEGTTLLHLTYMAELGTRHISLGLISDYYKELTMFPFPERKRAARTVLWDIRICTDPGVIVQQWLTSAGISPGRYQHSSSRHRSAASRHRPHPVPVPVVWATLL